MKELMNMLGQIEIVWTIHLGEFDLKKHLFHLSHLTPSLFSDNNSKSDIDTKSLKTDLVRNNTFIIDHQRILNILVFKVAIKILEMQPSLNCDLCT